MRWTRAWSAPAAAVAGVAAYDLMQKKHALLRNFPVVGHLRYLLESIGPELRQYIVSSNDEERPFSRDQRRWIYASAKLENNYFGFGTDNDMERVGGYPIIKHRTFSDVSPATDAHAGEEAVIPSAKVLGGPRGRAKAFRPNSVVNVSAMSFGSLSGPALEAINKGAALAGVLHNTGEGGISSHHRHGGDLIFQIGTAYSGCRDADGRFDLDKLLHIVETSPVRAIEIKLSQGAKPGLGGVLPAAKVSHEIADIRGINMGVDCVSPSRHGEFDDVDSMLDWVEMIATATGLPVSINAAVAFALGCDMVNVGREAMLALGCIQAQICHTDRCPVGVTTQNPWLMRGLDPELKSGRVANYIRTLRRDLLKVSQACGVWHPALIAIDDIAIMDGQHSSTPLREVYGYQPGWDRPGDGICKTITQLMSGASRGDDAPGSETAKS